MSNKINIEITTAKQLRKVLEDVLDRAAIQTDYVACKIFTHSLKTLVKLLKEVN